MKVETGTEAIIGELDASDGYAAQENRGPLPSVWQIKNGLIREKAVALIAERDALRDEWEEIAAGLTTEQPEVGALWPMVSEVSGSLAAVRLHFRNEVEAHNRTKAERDALRLLLREAVEFKRTDTDGSGLLLWLTGWRERAALAAQEGRGGE